MQQVLVRIPGLGIPLYGYGVMLFIALVVCTGLTARAAKRNGIDTEAIQDLALWMFPVGILTARLLFILEYHSQFEHWVEYFYIWRGGLVVYGSVVGAVATIVVFARAKRIPLWRLLDLVAPAVALGLGFGRIGCLLNGCCYGDYCEAPWAVRFPHGAPVTMRMIEEQHQTRLGFIVTPGDRRVLAVEPATDAFAQGLRVGDEIVGVNGDETPTPESVSIALLTAGADDALAAAILKQRGLCLSLTAPITLAVRRDGAERSLTFARPRSLPVHPTQLYASLSGFVLFVVLRQLYGRRRRDGEVVAWLATLYPLARFLEETLRYDEPPLLMGMTMSQNLSVLTLGLGIGLWVLVLRRPARYGAGPGLEPAGRW